MKVVSVLKWFESQDGRTWEQAEPFGPLLAVYNADGELIATPCTRSWEQIPGPKTEVAVLRECLLSSAAAR
jgi:hypothetical protein